LFAAHSFFLSSPVCLSRSKNCITSMMADPINKNRANRTATLLEKGGVSCAMSRPFIGCQMHIHATCNSMQTSIIGKRDLR
jgi:hypothetical protein